MPFSKSVNEVKKICCHYSGLDALLLSILIFLAYTAIWQQGDCCHKPGNHGADKLQCVRIWLFCKGSISKISEIGAKSTGVSSELICQWDYEVMRHWHQILKSVMRRLRLCRDWRILGARGEVSAARPTRRCHYPFRNSKVVGFTLHFICQLFVVCYIFMILIRQMRGIQC